MQYKKESIKQKLLLESKKEFLNYGYVNGKMSRIAENAGIPVGNVYRYFNGKSDMLDAIVSVPYNEILSMTEHLASVFCTIKKEDIGELVCKTLLNIYKAYGDALVILAHKCADTQYEDFLSKLTVLVKENIVEKIFDQDNKGGVFATICAKSVVNMVFDVYELGCEEEEMSKLFKKILTYHFCNIKERV